MCVIILFAIRQLQMYPIKNHTYADCTNFENKYSPYEEQDGGCSSLDGTGGRVDQQCCTDFCVPKYARDSLNLTTSSVESGFLVDGSSGASSEEGLALGAVGCGQG